MVKKTIINNGSNGKGDQLPTGSTPLPAGEKVVVFDQLITKFDSGENELSGTLRKRRAETAISTGSVDFVSFHRPTDVLVSRWYPGYRVTDLSGADAEESLGFMLADDMTKVIDQTQAAEEVANSLYGFQRLLGNPSIANAIILELLPRKGVPVRRDKYLVTEEMVGDVTNNQLAAYGETRLSVVSAISHVITRVFAHLELVLPSPEQKQVKIANSFAITPADLKKLIMVDSLRDLFSDARLGEIRRALDRDATPEIIAEVISKMLRTAASSIPEIVLKFQQIEIVQRLVHRFHVDPRSLSQVMQAYSGLQQLANFANFAVWAAKNPLSGFIEQNNTDLKEACDNILSVINSAPSIEAMSLNKYMDHFGIVPASASGIYRGAVMYQTKSQSSQMDVVQGKTQGAGWLVNQQPAEYTPISRIADELNRNILDPRSLGGLANLVADEISHQPFNLGDAPVLNTINVSDDDIQYVAMAIAETLSFVQVATSRKKGVGISGIPDIVYGVNVSEQFLMNVGAANPGTAFFTDPVAVVLYGLGDEFLHTVKEPIPLPSRKQSFDLPIALDTHFNGNISNYISSKVETPFKVKLPISITQTDGKVGSIDMVISVLPILLPAPDANGNITIVDSKVHYYSVNEPGVDKDIKLMLAMASEYQQYGNRVLQDRAKSWIIETLGNAMQHPVIVSMATTAVNRSLVAQSFDGRRLKSQFFDLMIMAYFSSLLGTLTRFNKVQATVAEDLIKNVPVPGLSIKASALLMSMPMQLNASSLYSGN